MMLAIPWSPTGFAVVAALERGCKFNAGYHASKVLRPLSEWWCERGGSDLRQLIIHAENARPHNATIPQQFMAQNAMVIAAHPPYWPDLAPSDFYIFVHVKDLFSGESFEIGERLLSAVEGLVASIAKSTLTRIFSRVDDETRAMC
jgi:histone-lysine N-methyltransferase SETMAR